MSFHDIWDCSFLDRNNNLAVHYPIKILGIVLHRRQKHFAHSSDTGNPLLSNRKKSTRFL